MSADVESRTAAALEAWASTVNPQRPAVDELLTRDATPLAPETPHVRRVRWVAAAAALIVVVAAGIVVAASWRGPSSDRNIPTITQIPAPSTTAVVDNERPWGVFAPTSVPAGYRVAAADAWGPSVFDEPVTLETWLRPGVGGATPTRLSLSASRAAPGELRDASFPATTLHNAQVHGLPAMHQEPDGSSMAPDTMVWWIEAGLRIVLSSTDGAVDVVAVAERTTVGPNAVALGDDALPSGFALVEAPRQQPAAEVSSSVTLMGADAAQRLSVTAQPNRPAQSIEGLAPPDAQRFTVGDRQLAITNGAGFSTAIWVENGSVVTASAPDDTSLLRLVETVQSVDEEQFDLLVDQATANGLAFAVQDAAMFADGLRVAVHATALSGSGTPPPMDARVCVQADQSRCGSATGSASGSADPGWAQDTAEVLVAADGRKEHIMWLRHPATEVRRLTDLASGDPIPYEFVAADHGVFLRTFPPQQTTTMALSAWWGGGDRSVGGSGMTSHIDVSREPIAAALSTSSVDPPEPFGHVMPTALPEGFTIESATASPHDPHLHEPISQDYWVRRDADGTTIDWLSVVAIRDSDGAVGPANPNLTINEQPARLDTSEAGLTTITWDENGQRIEARSTIDPVELATSVEFASVDADGGGVLLVSPARLEQVDRGPAIAAADPLAVSTTITLRHAAAGGVTITAQPNINGASFDTLPPLGEITYTTIGTETARITHFPGSDATTKIEWFTNGFLVHVEAQDASDEQLLAIARALQPVDESAFEQIAAGE